MPKYSNIVNICLIFIVILLSMMLLKKLDKRTHIRDISTLHNNESSLLETDLIPAKDKIDSLKISYRSSDGSIERSKTYINKSEDKYKKQKANINKIYNIFDNSHKQNKHFSAISLSEGNYTIEIFAERQYRIIECTDLNYFSLKDKQKYFYFYNNNDDFYFRFLRPLSCN